MASAIDMSKHFSAGELVKYTLPAIGMMVFTSVYGIVDGLFVSNFAGKTAFAAVNLIMPFITILAPLGYMMSSGGSAIISRTRGEGDDKRANAYFSLFVYFTIVMGAVLAIIGFIFMEPVARAFGASEEMLADCVLYGRISMVSLPLYMLQYAFQTFSSTAGKPSLGLRVVVASGITNMVLDALFVAGFGWGVAGAAWATVASEYVGGIVPTVYFARPNTSYLRLGRPSHDMRALAHACGNGSSEFVATIAMSVVAVVYNLQLMNYLGENGVAAYGTIMYAGWIFAAIFEGYCMGAAPLMSFQHGAHGNAEKRSLLSKSLKIVGLGGVSMFVLAQLLAWPFAWIFVSYNAELLALTEHAMRLYCISLIFMGVSMYASSLFTALGNGIISAVIAFLRTLVFEIGAVLLLPPILGADGIWLSVVVAEIFAFALSIVFICRLGPHYGLRK